MLNTAEQLNANVETQNPALKVLPSVKPATRNPLVLLHGWGCDYSIWGTFSEQLRTDPRFAHRDIWLVNLPGFGGNPLPDHVNLTNILAILSQNLPDKAVLIGWSLGGMLATAFAARWPDRVSELICLGTNACYSQQTGWPTAIPDSNMQLFRKQLLEAPERCMKRFRSTQAHGDQHQKTLLQTLLKRPESFHPGWVDMLDLLEQIDNRSALKHLPVKALYLFGEQDSLVPITASGQITQLNPDIKVETLTGVAHVLHLSAPAAVLSLLNSFLEETFPSRDKHQVALSFSRSAASYDRAAHLQRYTGEQLLKKLSGVQTKQPCVIDLGCGTGHFKKLLGEKLPKAQVLGIDLAEGMLNFAKTKQGGNQWCCGDAEQLPIASNAVDVLFSNLTVQWCDDLGAAAAEIYRILKPGGIALISTLGSNTLHELRTAWSEVDQYEHVNQFLPSTEIQQQFSKGSFSQTHLQIEKRLSQYANVVSLFKELKALGAHNVNRGRPTALTGKRRLVQIETAYEPFRLPGTEQLPGKLPATWEIVYMTLKKPTANENPKP